MNNNWYSSQPQENISWYSPLSANEKCNGEKTAGAASPDGVKQEKKRKRIRMIGLLLTLGVVLAAAFVKGLPFPLTWTFRFSENGTDYTFGSSYGEAKDDSDENLPDKFEDFFENYYTTIETENTDVRIRKSDETDEITVILNEKSEKDKTLGEIYSCCAPSVVGIEGYDSDDSIGYNWGTGIIISEDGLILTNTHVINGCDSAKVTLSDDTSYEAYLIGADSISDLAVLKIKAEGLVPAEFGDSSELKVGDNVAAIGNPLGSEFRCTMTDGIVSAIERGISYNGRNMSLIQTNAALNEGNSGGALVNMSGQVIGITNMKMMSAYSSIEGIGFAIPSSTVKTVVESLVRYGEVLGRPSIGITVGEIPENIVTHYEIPEGLYISDISDGSDAQKQGICRGDILTAVNGEAVKTTDDVLAVKDQLNVGDKMTLTIWREGTVREIEITLMETNEIYK